MNRAGAEPSRTPPRREQVHQQQYQEGQAGTNPAATSSASPVPDQPSRNPFLLQERPRSGCKPATRIAFAKTHKTGSSTVQNILLRYGVNHDLVFAMPNKSWMFSLHDPLDASLVLEGPWKELGGFDIFAFHCRWNHSEVSKMVPGAKFVTILREPLELFESNAVYFGNAQAKADFNAYAMRMATAGQRRGEKAYVGQNNLLWDLGVPARDVHRTEVADAKIREAEETFDLVMVMERFDESLVLLADLLCWPLEEVMYLKQNVRLSETKNVPTDETRDAARAWLHGDYKVRCNKPVLDQVCQLAYSEVKKKITSHKYDY